MPGQAVADKVDWSDETPEALLREMSSCANPVLLGLPCSRCGAYYEAEVAACPLCGCPERVSPTALQRETVVKSRAA